VFSSSVALVVPAGPPASLPVHGVGAAVLADMLPSHGISLVVHLAGVDTRPWGVDTLAPTILAFSPCLYTEAPVAAVCVFLATVSVAAFPRRCQRSTLSVATIFASST
jgi:hypothetical protein